VIEDEAKLFDQMPHGIMISALREAKDRIGYLEGKLEEIEKIAGQPDYGSLMQCRYLLLDIKALCVYPEGT